MIYSKTITSAINGTAANPGRVDFPVTNGLIYQVEIYLPPGSSGLLYIWIEDGAYQAWPSEPGERFYGDNVVISFPDKYWIKSPDHKLQINHYNLDDTYTHKFTVRLGQHSEEAFIASMLPSTSIEGIKESIEGMLSAQTDVENAAAIAALEYFGPSEPATKPEDVT